MNSISPSATATSVSEDNYPQVGQASGAGNHAKVDPAPTTTAKYVYRDWSRVPPDEGEPMLDAITNSAPDPPSVKHQKLPIKMDAILSDPELSHIISWMPHGRSWRILKPKLFVKEVLPKYFDYCNFNSFIRLVNAWGFRRFSSGPDRHSYYHEVRNVTYCDLDLRNRFYIWLDQLIEAFFFRFVFTASSSS